MTGLAQIAAEELDAYGPARRGQSGDRPSPDEGLTVGSMSTESSGAFDPRCLRRGQGCLAAASRRSYG